MNMTTDEETVSILEQVLQELKVPNAVMQQVVDDLHELAKCVGHDSELRYSITTSSR
jgi:hypothetical protein